MCAPATWRARHERWKPISGCSISWGGSRVEVSDDPGARGRSRPLPLSYAGYEFLLTTSLLFSVVTAVRWLRDPASVAYISALRPALAVLAGLTAVLLVALIRSPLGR